MRDAIGESKFANEVGVCAFTWATNDGQVHVTFCTNFGQCFKQVRQTLQRNVCRCGGDEVTRLTRNVWKRREELGVHSNWHKFHAVKGNFHVGVNVGDGVFTDHNNSRHFARNFSLHVDK